MNTINKTWFRNQLRKGNFLVKCTGKYTDDYAYDAAYNYFIDADFSPASPSMLDDWYIKVSYIWGEKDGIINLSFANCEYYDFKLKSNTSENQTNTIDNIFNTLINLANTELTDSIEINNRLAFINKSQSLYNVQVTAENVCIISSANSCYSVPFEAETLTILSKRVHKAWASCQDFPKRQTPVIVKVIETNPIVQNIETGEKPSKKRKRRLTCNDEYNDYLQDIRTELETIRNKY